jgi:tryptophanyl-tRNA synthetase
MIIVNINEYYYIRSIKKPKYSVYLGFLIFYLYYLLIMIFLVNIIKNIIRLLFGILYKMGKKLRILSGIQPSGYLHLGNYFGAMRQYLELQDENDSFFFIANLHAMNTIKDPKILLKNTIEVATSYLAIGLNPEKVSLFKQSDIPEVCELSWYLSTLTPMGLLERCHSYKDHLSKGLSPDHGIFAYPVLMAADILIYKSNIVPVGKDQKQHVEVARDIAIKFNNTYGNIFVVPDVRINEITAVVPGIDGQKMSKSYDNYISPFWEEKQIYKQVMKIVTDSTPVEMPKDPDKCNVFSLYKLLASKDEIDIMRNNYLKGGYGYGDAKKELYNKIITYFSGIRLKYFELKNNIDYVENILKLGAIKAREEASRTIEEVRKATGIK